ncbi:MAG: hypothetical protein Q6373_013665 [Candidatus Sigynarchaeota archaeon]
MSTKTNCRSSHSRGADGQRIALDGLMIGTAGECEADQAGNYGERVGLRPAGVARAEARSDDATNIVESKHRGASRGLYPGAQGWCIAIIWPKTS